VRRDNILETVGETPMVRLSRLFADLDVEVWAKLEGFNPTGSSKDRAAVRMLRDAERRGLLRPSTLVVEASSGNTGVALAQACTYLDLRFRCYVDPRTTATHIALLQAYGAEVERIEEPGVDGEYHPPKLERIEALLRSGADVYWPDQHANAENVASHRLGTIREILDDLGRPPDALLVATSTCGTLRGCMDALAQEGASTRVYAVDAHGSRIFADDDAPRHIPGLGASQPSSFAPGRGDVEVVHVRTHECVRGCRDLVEREAILAGASSGGVIHAIRSVASNLTPGAVCVGILPDRGDRYLDTVFNDDWCPSRRRTGSQVDGIERHPRGTSE